jgi:hypothetical protein
LAAQTGDELLPAMARLVRAAGEPVIGSLATQLSEPRHQRVATAIKLLAAVEPERLITMLPRVLPSWDWNLQDLAVTELSRQTDHNIRVQAAKVWLAVLRETDVLVVPGMLDQIAQAGEVSAAAQLLAIAAGTVDALRDPFIRVKAIQALGVLGSKQSSDVMLNLVRQRTGLTYLEPAAVRAAAQEALAMIGKCSASASMRRTRAKRSKSRSSATR